MGKTTTARVLAKALCCTSSDHPVEIPCDKCANCTAISKGFSVDVNEIDGASNNSVNDIRDLRDKIQYSPQQSRFKIYIIDEVHMLSTAAFNALLKTLEEPPEHVKFIFATTEAHKIPQTILSRCQRYDFKSVAAVEISSHLKRLLAEEFISASDGALHMVSRMARGSVRDALSLIDSVIAYSGESVSEEDIRVVLGLADAAIFSRLVSALLDREPADAFDAVAELVDYGHDLRQFGADFLEYLRDLSLVASTPAAAKSLTRPEAEVKEILSFAKRAEIPEWIAWFDLMVDGQERIARSEQARYMLELTLAKMMQIGKLRPMDDLLAGLSKLTRMAGQGGTASARQGAPVGAPNSTRSSSVTHSAPSLGNKLDTSRSTPQTEPKPVPKNWEELVEQIAGVSRMLWGHLRNVGLLEWSAERIRFECPDGSRTFKELSSPGGMKHLQATIIDILGHEIKIEITKGAVETKKVESIDDLARRTKRRTLEETIQKGEQDPKVLMIREVFGGGEVKVKPLKDRAG